MGQEQFPRGLECDCGRTYRTSAEVIQCADRNHDVQPRGNDPRIHSGFCPAAEGRECTCGMGFKPMTAASPTPTSGILIDRETAEVCLESLLYAHAASLILDEIRAAKRIVTLLGGCPKRFERAYSAAYAMHKSTLDRE
jgi:hypothetical protein